MPRKSPKNTSKLSVALLFDDSLDSNDGVSQQVKLLGGWLSERGHKVSYLVGETNLSTWHGGTVYSLSKNIRVRFNGNRLSMPMWSSRAQIKRVLSLEQPDIMHVMVPYSPFMSQRAIRFGKRQAGLIGSYHILPVGRLASLGAGLLGLYQWRSLKSFDCFTATSPNAAKFAKKSMRITARFIPNAVEVASFRNNARPIASRIVFLGRLVPRKGCRQLIEAFELVSRTDESAELIIAGDGPQRASLEQLVKARQLSDKVKFLGFVSEEDKPGLLGSATIACFPSLGGESFGVVLLEAMAAGSGVVMGGNNPGYQTVLGRRPELLFDPHNIEELAKKLSLFLNDRNKLQQIHVWQNNEIGRYDINIVGAEFETVYYGMIADKRSTRHNRRHERP